MITGELKSQIDKIRETFWIGGLSNPLTVIIEQIETLHKERTELLKQLKSMLA